MKLPSICIRKPVLAIVFSLVLVVLGVLGYQQLEIRFFPKLQLPVVNIWTTYEGASAALMESQVTTVIENGLSGVDGIQYVSSSSWNGASWITVQFKLGGDLESEAAQVRDVVAAAVQHLPSDADKPTVSVGTTGNPIVALGFIDQSRSPAAIRDYVLRDVQPLLQQLPGVGQVSVLGSSNYAMRIWLNPAKMAALGISADDVKTGLTSNNIYFPAGVIHSLTRNYAIVSDTQLKTPQAFANLIVKQTPLGTIRLEDIANVELGLQSLYDYPMRINGKNGIMLLIDPLQAANPIHVAAAVRAALKTIQSKLPPGMQVKLEFDLSQYLKASINETLKAIAEAVVLVILVVYLFLGSLRAASIPIITIPVSLIAVFAVIDWLGFTINMMSLLGMVLAIGLVVDDAIVMLENIHRHIEMGESPIQAAFKGSKEIGFAIVAMSITLFAVYAPVGLVQGFTAELFKEFAFTLASAVVISGFIALTLSPMMCSRVLTSEKKDSRFSRLMDKVFSWLSEGYRSVLEAALRIRLIIVGVLIAIAAGGYFLWMHLPGEFIPQEDYGVFNVSIAAPTGASMQYTEKYTRQIEALLKPIPEIDNFSTQQGVSSTELRVVMKPADRRKRSTAAVIAALNPELAKIPGVTAVASVPDIVNYGEQGSDVTLNFMTTGAYTDLLGPTNAMVNLLRQNPGLLDVKTNLKFDDQEYAISINRDLAANVGVSLQDVADTVHALLGGNHWGDVQSGTQSYQVLVQMEQKYLHSLNAIDEIYVPATPPDTPLMRQVAAIAPEGGFSKMIPLSGLVQMTPTIGQGALSHFDRMRSSTVTALLAPGYTESEALQYIRGKVGSVLKPDVRYAFSGKAAQFIASSGSMTGIFILSFLFIYLVLSAQFGSFIDPFIILLAVPLSLVGALFALWLGGGTINLYSQIGLVTLVGMISKHGILITEFTNDLRAQGVDFREALIEGAMIRLRPILMTTLAMIFGALPLAIATGAGSVGRQQIGWTIVGGLFFGTFFSLIVVPVAYSYFGKFRRIAPEVQDLS